MDTASTEYDYVLVGGGLQNGLLLLALAEHQPEAKVALLEKSSELAGNHTWCFHSGDLREEQRQRLSPLIAAEWPGYTVRFPRHTRELDCPYAMISAQRMRAVLDKVSRHHPSFEIHVNAKATNIGAQLVQCQDGRQFHSKLVIDARGPGKADIDHDHTGAAKSGFQKFVGIELRTASPHGITRPILMDATVEQEDGYRFVYVLPLTGDVLLIEDTRFSDGPKLDRVELRKAAMAYGEQLGVEVAEILREEDGVLPLPWSGRVVEPSADHAIVAGFAGGWYHPVTGYSFPLAARLAEVIATTSREQLFNGTLKALSKQQRKQLGFAHRLNKMFFRWFPPEQRFHVLERFYTLPSPVIERFYAMQMTDLDRARMLVGRPPRGMSYKAALFGRSV